MICKICNANIEDNATVCPFCNSPVTMDVDPAAAPVENTAAPAFPDPASASFNNPIPDPVPAASPITEPAAPITDPASAANDLGLSEPAAPFTDPMASQPQNQDPYMDPAGAIPNGQPVQPNYNMNQNPNGFGQTPPPTGAPQNNYNNNYSGGYTNPPDPTADLENQANTVQTLGIVALIVAIVVGFCCCALAGPGVGIAGLIKYNKIKDSLYLLSPEGQKKANNGRILSIIAIVLGALGIVANIVMMSTGMLESIADYE